MDIIKLYSMEFIKMVYCNNETIVEKASQFSIQDLMLTKEFFLVENLMIQSL